MISIKSIRFDIVRNKRLEGLLRSYRKGKNLFIQYLDTQQKTSLGAVNAFRQEVMKQTNLCGINSVKCSRDALGIYRRYKKKKTALPIVKRLSMSVKLGYNGKLEGDKLRITISSGNYVYVELKLGEYQQEFLRQAEEGIIRLGEIIVTPTHCIFTVKKEYTSYMPKGVLALDINERNIVSLAMTNKGVEIRTWTLEPIYELNCKYFEMMRGLQRRYPHDKGLQQRVLSRWFRNRNNKKNWYLHNILNEIINYAEQNKLLIVQESLKGLKKGINRKVMKKNKYTGKVQRHRRLPRKILGRLNRAVFNQIQNSLDYKAQWKNIPYTYVSARNNSSTCPICGGKNKSAEWHTFQCSCGIKTNRHLLACVNMLEKKRHENESPRYRPDRDDMYIMRTILSVNVPV